MLGRMQRGWSLTSANGSVFGPVPDARAAQNLKWFLATDYKRRFDSALDIDAWTDVDVPVR